MTIRRLTPADLPEVLRIQQEAYAPQLLECGGTFSRKVAVFSEGALGCFDGAALVGYLFCHPWLSDRIVPLDHPLRRLPAKPDCLYLHDLAVSTRWRRRGVATKLLHAAFELGDTLKLRAYCLVAVQSSETFWTRFGFEPHGAVDQTPGVPGTRMTLVRNL